MENIRVKASREYNVTVGSGILSDCGKILAELKNKCTVAIISDDVVFPLYGDTVKKSLEAEGYAVIEYVFPNGEQSKNINTASSILEFLAENKLTRSDMILALGGGVVGDMSGFCAAIYLRGIPYVQVPTTFLAAIDSSVGGKTGVDLPCGKNLVGAFNQPLAVLCDTDTFDTLSYEIFCDGLCEAIKYGCILDQDLFSLIESGKVKENIESVVTTCVKLKRDVVEEDEFDTGLRSILNFGHTIGHAVESLSEYKISHGRAVGMGMVAIENCIDRELGARIKAVLDTYKIDSHFDFTVCEIVKKALSDKKRAGNLVTLVLVDKIGKARLEKIPCTDLEEFFSKGIR